MAQLMEVNKEMELVCQTLNLAYPPSEQDMAKIYGSNAPSIPPKVLCSAWIGWECRSGVEVKFSWKGF